MNKEEIINNYYRWKGGRGFSKRIDRTYILGLSEEVSERVKGKTLSLTLFNLKLNKGYVNLYIPFLNINIY